MRNTNLLPKLHALSKDYAGGGDVHELLHETAVSAGIMRESLREIAHDWTACQQLLRKVQERHGVRSLPQSLVDGDYLRSEADVRRYLIDHILETQHWSALAQDVMERIILSLDVLRRKYATRALQKKKADWLMEHMKKRRGKEVKPEHLKAALDAWLEYEHERWKKERYFAGIVRNTVDACRKADKEERERERERRKAQRLLNHARSNVIPFPIHPCVSF